MEQQERIETHEAEDRTQVAEPSSVVHADFAEYLQEFKAAMDNFAEEMRKEMRAIVAARLERQRQRERKMRGRIPH